MTNLARYNNIFLDTLGISEVELGGDLVYQSLPSWDSVGHMALVTALETTFDIMFDTSDTIDFSSYEKGKDILKKYGIDM